ncbi:MAG: hypothetical protein KAI94_02150, partial [Anaerolineales bacterium]|nr:hypothetical protein [Anaerolineales bacterium]
PNSIPVADWVKIYLTNHNTGACSPYTVRIYDGSTGFPAEGVEVWLARSSNLPDLQQGTTNASGKIEIFGAHNGDRLHFRKGSASGWIPVSCSTSLVATQSEVDGTIEPDPFSLDVRVVPISADMVKVQVSSSTALPASPSSSVWQDGADSPITVPLTYDAGNDHYIGEATLDNSLGATGYVYVEAANGEEQIVQKRQPFNIIPIVATESNPRLYSADGNFELVLPAGSLSDNAVISIQQTTVEKDTQGNLVRVSSPYQVLLSTEQNDLNKNAIVNMRYHADKVANILTETLQLYHWSEETGQWIPDGGLVDEAFFIVSAEVEQISTFALLGQLDDVVEIYLPGVLKDFP